MFSPSLAVNVLRALEAWTLTYLSHFTSFNFELAIFKCIAGVNGEYFAFSGGTFEGGHHYRIRLKSNGSYVELPVKVNSPAYNGNCCISANVGK